MIYITLRTYMQTQTGKDTSTERKMSNNVQPDIQTATFVYSDKTSVILCGGIREFKYR